MSDMLIKGGTVIDGTGAPARRADVRVRNGVIRRVAPDLAPEPGERVFDASGCQVTPGFIGSAARLRRHDHDHGQLRLLRGTRAR